MKHIRASWKLVVILSFVMAGCQDGSSPTPAKDPNAGSSSTLYDWLVQEAVPVHTTIRVDAAKAAPTDPNDRRQLVGATTAVNARIDLAGVSASQLSATPRDAARGAIRASQDGFVWSGVVEAPSAWAVRFEMIDFSLPPGAELYLYSDNGEVAGPYNGRGFHDNGTFWSHALRGSAIGLQLRYSGTDIQNALDSSRFAIADAGVMDDRFRYALYGAEVAHKSFCSFNEPCVENAACSTPGPVGTAQNAVALMLYTSGGGQYICSGGLLSDSSNSGTPYFLTANHCVSKGREASSLQTFFHFQTSCQSPDCAFPDTSSPSTTGSSIKATSRTSDFTLLELSGAAPAGAAFLPTNSNPIAFSDGASLYRISHPGGAPQAYSEHEVDTSAGTCSSWPRGNWIYSRDTYGATEGGSSGSPVLNSAGEVVGHLSGGCGTNVNDTCDAVNNATVDGALAAYWDQVAPFLDNGGGTCELGQPGDSCSSDADCCSNKCKGSPSNRTCR